MRSGSAVGGGIADGGATNASGVGGSSGGVRYDSMPMLPITIHSDHVGSGHGSVTSVVQMPAMIFGTAGRSAKEVRAALKAGWRHLDLAEMYGNEVGLKSESNTARSTVQHQLCDQHKLVIYKF